MYVDEKTVEKPKVSILPFIYIISTTVLTYITSYEKRKGNATSLHLNLALILIYYSQKLYVVLIL